MADVYNVIQIKRSNANVPAAGSLKAGELAYSFGSAGSDKLYIGTYDGTGVNIIGGKYFTDKVDTFNTWHTNNDAWVALTKSAVASSTDGTYVAVVGDGSLFKVNDGSGDVSLKAYINSLITTAAVPVTGTDGRIAVTDTTISGKPGKKIDLVTTDVTAGSYGSATKTASFTVDAYGRLTAASEQAISAVGIKDSAGDQKFTVAPGEAIKFSPDASTSATTVVTFDADNKEVKYGVNTGVIATRSYVDESISSLGTVYKVKGSVQTYAELPNAPSYGDVYNVVSQSTHEGKVYPAGTNYVWVQGDASLSTSDHWDPLGGTVDLSSYINAVSEDGTGNTVVSIAKDSQTVKGTKGNRLTTVVQDAATDANYVSAVALDTTDGAYQVKVTSKKLTLADVKDVTATVSEVNQLAGAGATTADFEKLVATTVSAAELNAVTSKLDGVSGTAATGNNVVTSVTKDGTNVSVAYGTVLDTVATSASSDTTALVVDSVSKDSTDLNKINVTTKTLSLNTFGVTVSASDLNAVTGKLDGVNAASDASNPAKVVVSVAQGTGDNATKVVQTNANVGDVALGSYAKATANSAIASTDTLSVALGKLEYRLENIDGGTF